MLNTETVVLAKVIDQYETEFGQEIRFQSTLQVLDAIKGSLTEGNSFVMENYHRRIGELERIVSDDLELKSGVTYLLFLQEQRQDVWQATMLSYGALELQERESEELLIPIGMGQDPHFEVPAGRPSPEALGVYYKDALLGHFRDILSGASTWNKNTVVSPYPISQFQISAQSDPPDFCNYLSDEPLARWEDMEVNSLPVRISQAGDGQCASAGAFIDDAISSINTNYLGLSLTNSGTHGYIPSCSGDGAFGQEFTDWIENNLGGFRHSLIQFDDPCNEIGDLINCTGTLAIGGLYIFSSTYSYNNTTYRNAAYGFVLTNDGTGNCFCNAGSYDILMAHEMTHTLNIDHVPAIEGSANMNPTCCNDISNLDIDCVNFLYEPLALPVDLKSFEGQPLESVIQLDWAVGLQVNNDYFTVEKQNINGEFIEIYQTAGAGNSAVEQQYRFIDREPNDGDNIYRLIQVDYNGSRNELGLVNIVFEKGEALELDVYPNPVQQTIFVDGLRKENAPFNIYSLNGQLVLSGKLSSDNNQLNLSNLQKGAYILEIEQGGIRKKSSFMKMR